MTVTTPDVTVASAFLPARELLAALKFTAIGIGGRYAPVPASTRVRLTAVGATGLMLTAFDYTTVARETLSSSVEGALDVAVDHKALLKAVKSLPVGAAAVLSVDDKQLHVHSVAVGGRTSLDLFDLAEMPVAPNPTMTSFAHLTDDHLRTVVARVAPVASTDTTLPILTAVKFDADDAQLRVAATDRYRLAEVLAPHVHAAGHVLLVPAGPLAKAVKHFTDTVGIAFDTAYARFRSGDREAIIYLVDGDYPRIHQLFPPTGHPQLRFARQPMLDAVKAVGTARQPVTLVAQGDHVVVRSGTDFRTVEADITGAFPDEVSYNTTFLCDALSGRKGDGVMVTLATYVGHKPAVITRDDEPDTRQLLMPVRLS